MTSGPSSFILTGVPGFQPQTWTAIENLPVQGNTLIGPVPPLPTGNQVGPPPGCSMSAAFNAGQSTVDLIETCNGKQYPYPFLTNCVLITTQYNGVDTQAIDCRSVAPVAVKQRIQNYAEVPTTPVNSFHPFSLLILIIVIVVVLFFIFGANKTSSQPEIK